MSRINYFPEEFFFFLLIFILLLIIQQGYIMLFSRFALLKTPSTFYFWYLYDSVTAGVEDKIFLIK